jgi:chemotaxis protein MotB
MQRFAAAMLVALVGVTALMAVGCVEDSKYNAVLLRNREQEKLLQEKDAQLATLDERIKGQQARLGDVQRVIAEKDDHLATVMRERDAVRKAFDELLAMYPKALETRTVAPQGIPDVVVTQLRQLAKQYGDLFDFDEATGRLRFKADVTFDSGSNAVKAEAKTALGKLGTILAADVAKGIRVEIVGHTDTDKVAKAETITLLKGLKKTPDNQGLSEARAESVADILKTAKVAGARITTKGVGASQPLDAAPTAAAKAKNRRVEIWLSSSTAEAPVMTPTPAVMPAVPALPLDK